MSRAAVAASDFARPHKPITADLLLAQSAAALAGRAPNTSPIKPQFVVRSRNSPIVSAHSSRCLLDCPAQARASTVTTGRSPVRPTGPCARGSRPTGWSWCRPL